MAKLCHWSMLLACGSTVLAQELRRVESVPFTHACFDPIRGRVIAAGYGNYSQEWDGARWRRAPDAGARPGILHFDGVSGLVLRLEEHDPWFPWPTTYTYASRSGMTWQSFAVALEPGRRWGQAFAPDPATGRLLAFGGQIVNGFVPAMLDQTWIFDGATWTQRQPAVAPPPRGWASAAFDSTRQRVVLFGGTPGWMALDDTWEWDGASWTNVMPPTRPPARFRASMVFDAIRQRIVLVGGNSGLGPFVDHWEFDGTDWVQVPLPASMAALSFPGPLVFDSWRGETLLLGGYGADARPIGDVFAWNGLAWTPRPGFASLPPPSDGAAVSPDPPGTNLLRFGEPYLVGGSCELWSWDGAAWTNHVSGTSTSRVEHAMWWQAGATFVFGGGAGGAQFNDTLRWDGVTWTQIPTPTSPPARRRTAVCSNLATGMAVLFGGLDPTVLGDTWTFDGSNWTAVNVLPQPPARYRHSLAYDLARNRTVLFGGRGTSPTQPDLSDTWEWDGAAWYQVVTTHAPGIGATIAFDWVLQRVVAWSRVGTAAEVWTFDGVDWTPMAVLGDRASTAPLPIEDAIVAASLGGRFSLVDRYGVVELTDRPARAISYGADCGAASPVLAAASLPIPGDAAFALELTRLPGNGIALLAASDTAVSVPLLGCTLLLVPLVTFAMIASPVGFATMPVPLPGNPALVGQSFFFQAAALTPAGPAGLAFSAGLRVDFGQ